MVRRFLRWTFYMGVRVSAKVVEEAFVDEIVELGPLSLKWRLLLHLKNTTHIFITFPFL